MRLIKILMLAALLSVLPACAVSTKYVSPPPAPQLAQPDSSLTQDCDRPADIGDKPLSQSKTEGFWMKDRQALIECGRSKRGLRDFYADRDGRLAGKR